jgi:hypothetical protein
MNSLLTTKQFQIPAYLDWLMMVAKVDSVLSSSKLKKMLKKLLKKKTSSTSARDLLTLDLSAIGNISSLTKTLLVEKEKSIKVVVEEEGELASNVVKKVINLVNAHKQVKVVGAEVEAEHASTVKEKDINLVTAQSQRRWLNVSIAKEKVICRENAPRKRKKEIVVEVEVEVATAMEEKEQSSSLIL